MSIRLSSRYLGVTDARVPRENSIGRLEMRAEDHLIKVWSPVTVTTRRNKDLSRLP